MDSIKLRTVYLAYQDGIKQLKYSVKNGLYNNNESVDFLLILSLPMGYIYQLVKPFDIVGLATTQYIYIYHKLYTKHILHARLVTFFTVYCIGTRFVHLLFQMLK